MRIIKRDSFEVKGACMIWPLFLFLQLNFLWAAETDHYSVDPSEVVDIAESLNRRANDYLSLAVKQTKGCHEQALYKKLKIYFANHSKGKLGKELVLGDDFKKVNVAHNDSVYANWGILNGFLLGRKKASKSPLGLAPLIKIGDQVIGTDKIEHMFGMGFSYFHRFYFKEKSLFRVLKYGIFSEKTILGGNRLATGVFSYADLAANFNGMRFWNHILGLRKDIIGHDIGPYVECVEDKFVIVKKNPIDFRNYIDASMDESINCAKFASRGGKNRFYSNMKKLDQVNRCPMDEDKFLEMVFKYEVYVPGRKEPLSHWLLNYEGHGKLSFFNEF